MLNVVRRGAVVSAVVVAVGVLGACKAPAWPGTPTPGPSPSTSPTGTPSAEPTGEPTTTPTTDPSDPTLPGGSDGVEVRVEIEPGYSMPNLVESSLKQARRTLEQQGAIAVHVVDARRGDAVAGQSNGWTVCAHEPAAGNFTLESAEVVLAAAPNARQCP